MKRSLLAIALMTGCIFMASSVFANPALLKKRHDGYPNPDGGTTATGSAAAQKSAAEAPQELDKQNRDAMGGVANESQLKRSQDSRLPAVVGPGHVTTKGVTENQIKDATKVNANPR
jgi:hypothetical protein